MDDKKRWKAVLSRDSRWNGRFVYAVRSTGIYCRPSCPSRRPRRDQVVFFGVSEAAERVGFRPCRRCRPQQAAYDPRLERVRQAISFIHSRTDAPPTLMQLSAHVGVSPYHLQREFKRVMGIAPRQYADARRVGRFKETLREGNSLTGSIYDAGYGSSSRLYEQAGAQLGMTPATYRRGGKGAEISYAITGCPLGRLLVAATRRGVGVKSALDSCSLFFLPPERVNHGHGVKSLVGQTSPSPGEGRGGGTKDCRVADPGTSTQLSTVNSLRVVVMNPG